MIFLHSSKAFGYVWHKGLLAQLPMFDLHCTLIKLIASFLSQNLIGMRVDGFHSKPHSINSGIPKGSVISPIMFILFIGDPLSSISSNIYSFADDTYLCSSLSSNPQHLAYSNVSPCDGTLASLLIGYLTNIEK